MPASGPLSDLDPEEFRRFLDRVKPSDFAQDVEDDDE
jgi:hypothetical protein